MSQCPCIWRYKFCTLKQRSKWALYNWSTFVNYHFSHVFNGYFDSYLFQFLTIANIERVVNGQQQCNKKGYQIIFEVLQNWLDSEFYHFCCENGLRQPLLIIVFNFNQLSDLTVSQWTIMIIYWIFIEISQGQDECYIIDPFL